MYNNKKKFPMSLFLELRVWVILLFNFSRRQQDFCNEYVLF